LTWATHDLIRPARDRGEDRLLVERHPILMHDEAVLGASVGDSEAWLVGEATIARLTNGQVHKPLLGSGRAIPVGFGPVPLAGRLIVASDGLFKYCTEQRIVAACGRPTAGVPRADGGAGGGTSYGSGISTITRCAF
jgi:hypothetical protein